MIFYELYITIYNHHTKEKEINTLSFYKNYLTAMKTKTEKTHQKHAHLVHWDYDATISGECVEFINKNGEFIEHTYRIKTHQMIED